MLEERCVRGAGRVGEREGSEPGGGDSGIAEARMKTAIALMGRTHLVVELARGGLT